MRLLIIEDDAALCQALKLNLCGEGYDVDLCRSGGDAEYYLSGGGYGAVVLDRMLPEVDGLTLLKRLRSGGDCTPVLMLTAMDSLHDKTDGLDAGADDYLVKPFAMAELLSRLRALLRRPSAIQPPDALRFGRLRLDPRGRTLSLGEKAITLSGKESAMLELFFENPEKPLSRARILARVWGGDDTVEEGNVDNYIYFIRRRLRSIGGGAQIKSVHGLGFQLTEDGSDG